MSAQPFEAKPSEVILCGLEPFRRRHGFICESSVCGARKPSAEDRRRRGCSGLSSCGSTLPATADAGAAALVVPLGVASAAADATVAAAAGVGMWRSAPPRRAAARLSATTATGGGGGGDGAAMENREPLSNRHPPPPALRKSAQAAAGAGLLCASPARIGFRPRLQAGLHARPVH
jgi:hypothetical protein